MKDGGETGEPKEPWEPPDDDPVVPGPRGKHSALSYRTREELETRLTLAELAAMLWRYVRGLGLDEESAEGVVETTLQALANRVEPIAGGSAVMWLRATAREMAEQSLPQMRSTRARPEPLVTHSERDSILWAHVEALPDHCRRLLRAIAFQDFPDYAELARLLGISRGGVGRARGLCLAMLRNSLSRDSRWTPTNEAESRSEEYLSAQPLDEGDIATLRAIASLFRAENGAENGWSAGA